MRKNVCIYFCEPHLHDKLRLSMPDKRFRSAVSTTCTMASFQITEMALKILTVKAIRQIFSVLWLLLYYTCLLFCFLKVPLVLFLPGPSSQHAYHHM